MNAASRNVELKARDLNPERSLAVCRSLGAQDHGELWQRDTYFPVSTGRLKLREQRPGGAHLIHYDRADCAEQRESRYRLAPVQDPTATVELLAAALGIRMIVTKRRRLWLHGAVRIHLDEVDRLGHFIEFEALAPTDSDLSHEQQLVTDLCDAFDLSGDRLIETGYADMIEHQTTRDMAGDHHDQADS